MPSAALSERTRRVLASLVRDYIDSGEPVASATLSRRAGLGVSPATIRNVLAQLEDMGYVSQPHTSAGRVPTDLGYRYYVDMLLEARRNTRDQLTVEARMREQAGEAPLFERLLSTRLARAVRGVAPRRLRHRPVRRARALPTHRLRAAVDRPACWW